MKTKCIRVHFYDDRGNEQFQDYDYFYEGEAEVGDHAVVFSNRYCVVKVVAVFSRKTSKATKWAFVVFNSEKVKEMQTKATRRSELLEMAMSRAEELRQMESLARLAENDESLKGILEELKGLE